MSENIPTMPVGSSDQLGPAERAALDALLDHIDEYGTVAEGVWERAMKLCQTARAAEREQCAKMAEEYATYGGSNFSAAFHDFAAKIRSKG